MNLKTIIGQLMAPLARRVTKSRPRVLFYHRFALDRHHAMSARMFEDQIVYLKKHFNIVPLQTITEALARSLPMPQRTVALTVDDGYADFLSIAYPIIERHRVPITVFVVSGFSVKNEWLWFDRIRFVCENTNKDKVKVETPRRVFEFRLSNDLEKESAWDELCSWCLRIPTNERLRLISAFESIADVEVPAIPPEKYRSLTLDEINSMDGSLVEIGAHTKTHVILSSCSDEEQLQEIEGSKQDLERFLNRPIKHFAYPNGQAADFNWLSKNAVAQSGFLASVTVRSALIDRNTDRFVIPRLCASFDMNVFKNEVNGLAHLNEILTIWKKRIMSFVKIADFDKRKNDHN